MLESNCSSSSSYILLYTVMQLGLISMTKHWGRSLLTILLNTEEIQKQRSEILSLRSLKQFVGNVNTNLKRFQQFSDQLGPHCKI